MDYTDVFLQYASKHTWTRLAPSKIHGVGVFAIIDIPENCDIFPDCLNRFKEVDVKKLEGLPDPVQKMAKDLLYYDEEEIWIPDLTLNQINLSFLLNSSDNPNCRHHHNGKITSIRRIKAGEELTHCYQLH